MVKRNENRQNMHWNDEETYESCLNGFGTGTKS